MFGRRSHNQRPQLPDLDSQVTAHWNRGVAPANPPPPMESPSESLDFAPTPYSVAKTKERSRGRRRLLLSLLMGLVLGPILVAAAFYLMQFINPARRQTETLGERMTFGPRDDEEIFYTDDISTEQVRQLGAFLQREGVFDGQSSKSVRLSRRDEVFVVGFAVEWNSWELPDVATYFRDVREQLSIGAFNGSPVEVHLCARQADSKGQPMPAMRVICADGER